MRDKVHQNGIMQVSLLYFIFWKFPVDSLVAEREPLDSEIVEMISTYQKGIGAITSWSTERNETLFKTQHCRNNFIFTKVRFVFHSELKNSRESL